MKNLALHLAVFFTIMMLPVVTQAIPVEWASTVLSTNISNAADALGAPDDVVANFQDFDGTTTETATYAGFGSGDNANYDSASLATFLGISGSLLRDADFISFERNLIPSVSYESSDWIFSDGTNSLTVSHTFGGGASGPIIAIGTVSNIDYASFFGVSLTVTNRDYVYLLFDVDGNSNVNPFAPNFSVTLNALGSGNFGNDSPDPDVLGRVGKPIPAPFTLFLLGMGLIGMFGVGFQYRKQGIVEIVLE